MASRNPYLCLVVVVWLGMSVIVGLVGSIMLAWADRQAPPILGYAVSTAIGALASILVAVPSRAAEPGVYLSPNSNPRDS